MSLKPKPLLIPKFLKSVFHLHGLVILAMVALMAGTPAQAAGPVTVDLRTADAFAVLGSSTVTNTGPTVVTGDLGVSPGTAVTGFPPGTVNGEFHVADAVAQQAQTDLTGAYNDAAGRTGTAVPAELGGRTLTAGVYRGSDPLELTGTLTLDGQGDENAVFIFQTPSTLTTASGSRVALIGNAQACNVFWQVASSATLGTDSTLVGSILAQTSITLTTGAAVDGRALARGGAVTLDSNRVTRAVCAAAPVTTTTIPGEGTTATTGPDGGTSATTGPDGGTTGTTGPDGGTTGTTGGRRTTASTIPDGGTTATTGPGGGTTDTVSRPPLASTGARSSQVAALCGMALTGLGLLFRAATRRRPGSSG